MLGGCSGGDDLPRAETAPPAPAPHQRKAFCAWSQPRCACGSWRGEVVGCRLLISESPRGACASPSRPGAVAPRVARAGLLTHVHQKNAWQRRCPWQCDNGARWRVATRPRGQHHRSENRPTQLSDAAARAGMMCSLPDQAGPARSPPRHRWRRDVICSAKKGGGRLRRTQRQNLRDGLFGMRRLCPCSRRCRAAEPQLTPTRSCWGLLGTRRRSPLSRELVMMRLDPLSRL